MSSTSVSVLLPLRAGHSGDSGHSDDSIEAIRGFLESTGFEFEILPQRGGDYGALLRRGVSEARGETVVIVDDDLPYAVSAIGDAVAMIQSGSTDIVFGT